MTDDKEGGAGRTEYTNMEGKELPPNVRDIFEAIMRNSDPGSDFVLIRTTPDMGGLGQMILTISTMEVLDRLPLIFNALRKDLGEEVWTEVVRRLAEKELISLMGRKIVGAGNAN